MLLAALGRKAQLELKLDRTVGDNKKRVFKMAKGSIKITSAGYRMRMATSQTGT